MVKPVLFLVGAIPIVTKTKSDIDLSAVGPHAEFINQTSGTTGKAKYMHKTPDVMYTRMEMSKSYLPFDVGQETLLSLAPMYHSMGLDHGMVQSVMCKSNFVYLNKFTPKRFFKEMSKYKPTIIQLGSPRNANIILNAYKGFELNIPEDSYICFEDYGEIHYRIYSENQKATVKGWRNPNKQIIY